MKGSHVLIIEDEIIVAEDIKRTLQNLGYIVSAVVPSGEEAVKIIEDNTPDLILMDIVLHGEMDGIETAKQISSNYNIPVIYITAYSDEKILERAKVTEPFGYIIKPFKERELHINIEIALYKHQMENKSKESRKWYSTTLKSIGDGVIAVDSNGTVSYMNPVAESMTGWKLYEAAGKPLEEVYNILNPNESGMVDGPVTRTRLEGVYVGKAYQTVMITKNNSRIPIEESSDPIRDDKGNIIGSVMVFRDVTEDREVHNENEALMEIYESVLNSIATGIFVTNKDDVVNYVNKKMEPVVGIEQIITGKGILPDSISDVFNPYYLMAKDTLQPVYYKDVPFVIEVGHRESQSGRLIPLIKDGEYNGMICTVEDMP